jgi:uncharacterized protein (DUF4213/DUF364 family)
LRIVSYWYSRKRISSLSSDITHLHDQQKHRLRVGEMAQVPPKIKKIKKKKHRLEVQYNGHYKIMSTKLK